MPSKSFRKDISLPPIRYRTPSPPRHVIEPISPILTAFKEPDGHRPSTEQSFIGLEKPEYAASHATENSKSHLPQGKLMEQSVPRNGRDLRNYSLPNGLEIEQMRRHDPPRATDNHSTAGRLRQNSFLIFPKKQELSLLGYTVINPIWKVHMETWERRSGPQFNRSLRSQIRMAKILEVLRLFRQ